VRAPISIVSAGSTDVGARRKLNEDAYLAAAPLFMVADGMGGHDAGEVASSTVIEQFSRLIGKESLSIVGSWLVVNIGDSRTYQFANGELEQITVDHSYVQELIDEGELTPGEAMKDPRRNIITRAIGAGSVGEADYWLFPAERGDRMLICSDGLTTELTDDRIAEILAAQPDPQRAADILTAEAVRAGGRDNVTVVVVDALSVATARGMHLQADAEDDLADTRPRAAQDGGMR
jgi:protein phosphatase